LHADWEALATANGQAPVFLRPQWFEIGSRLGVITPWSLLVIQAEQRLIGLLVLHRRTPWTADTCEFLSMNNPPVLIDPLYEEAAWAGFTKWFQQQSHCHMLSLGRWHVNERLTSVMETVHANGIHPSRKALVPDHWLPLPNSWDAYLAGIGKATRYNLRRREAQLHRDFGDVTVEIVADPAGFTREAEAFFAIHHRRWRHEQTDSFRIPAVRQFYREVMDWTLGEGSAAMLILRVQGQAVTMATVFHTPGQHAAHFHVIARDPDALPRKYSPGIVVLSHLIRYAIDHGAQHLIMGHGSDYYKTLLGAEEYALCELYAARTPTEYAVFSKLDPLMHIIRHLPRTLSRRVYSIRQSLHRKTTQE